MTKWQQGTTGWAGSSRGAGALFSLTLHFCLLQQGRTGRDRQARLLPHPPVLSCGCWPQKEDDAGNVPL